MRLVHRQRAFEYRFGEAKKVALGNDADEPASLDDGKATDLVTTQELERLEGRSRGLDRHDISVHHLPNRDRLAGFAVPPGQLAEQGSMGDQSDQSMVLILHRHVPNVTPLHDAGNEVQDLVLIDGKEVGGHQRADPGVG